MSDRDISLTFLLPLPLPSGPAPLRGAVLPSRINGVLFDRYQRAVRLTTDTNEVHVSRESRRDGRRD